MILNLEIDGKSAIYGYGDLDSKKCYHAEMGMPADQIAALLSSEKEPQPKPREVGDVIDRTRRNLK